MNSQIPKKEGKMQIEVFYLRCHLKCLSNEGQVLPSSKDSTPLSSFLNSD